MTILETAANCRSNRDERAAHRSGDNHPRGVEKLGGFFRLGGAPSTPFAAEKRGGFFSTPLLN